MQHGVGEIIEGALAAMTPIAFAARAVVVGPPRINIVALAPGTLQGPVFPSQGMDVGLTLFEVKELMYIGQSGH
jgi:hypothetical protein